MYVKRSGKLFHTGNVTCEERAPQIIQRRNVCVLCACSKFFCLSAAWQHPGRASLRDTVASTRHRQWLCPARVHRQDRHTLGVKVQHPSCAVMQWEPKNTWVKKKKRKKKDKNTLSELHEIKTLQTAKYFWEDKCHRPFSLSWKKIKWLFSQKKVTSQIVVNGCFVSHFWFSAWNPQNKNKTKKKKGESCLHPSLTHWANSLKRWGQAQK